jgi:hypothetical protein
MMNKNNPLKVTKTEEKTSPLKITKSKENLVLQYIKNKTKPKKYMETSFTKEFSIDHMYGILTSLVIMYIYVPTHKTRYVIHHLETGRDTQFSLLQTVYTLYMICPFINHVNTHLSHLKTTYE